MSALPWHKDKLLAFDVETTGVDVHEDRIVTASIVYIPAGLRPQTYTWVINPGIPVPDEASAVHGWTTERLAASPEARDPGPAIGEIIGKLAYTLHRSGAPLIAMNAAFDLTILEAEAARYGIDPLSARLERGVRPVVDPMVLDKQVDPWRPGKCDGLQKRAPRCTCGAENKRLTGLATHYGVLLGDAHAAHADALAAARVVWRLVEKYPALQEYDLQQLHDAQVVWRAEQQESLAGYFRRQGNHEAAASCNGEWPIQSRPVASERVAS